MLQGKTKAEVNIFLTLAKRMGLKAKYMTISEIEDLSLANAMKKGRTGKFVDTQKFLKE